MSTVWESLKESLRSKLPAKSFSLWIEPLTLLNQESGALLLGCPNKFSSNWVMENYGELIQERLRDLSAGSLTFRLKVKLPPKALPAPLLKDEAQMVLPHVEVRPRRGFRTLNHDFTFDRFVVGKCNEFAYSASKALALGSHFSHNPLFILASTGLGKSHLSQAVGHALLQKKPDMRVYYITAEDFVNEMIWSLKNNAIEQFKNKYRQCCDALLLEEVQFFSGKEKTQLELGYTLDALADDHKKIIFTSSIPPKDIPNLNNGLYSRLNAGLIATLEMPDCETRMKILEKKAAEQNVRLSEEIIQLLAKKLTGDIRQMESALHCLKAKSELIGAKIDMDLAREVLKSLISEQTVTHDGIMDLVCRYFKIDSSALESKSRKAAHSHPRNAYIYLCRRHTNMTVEEIGKTIHRSHSTVLYACEVMERRIKTDPRVKNEINFLTGKLRNLQA